MKRSRKCYKREVFREHRTDDGHRNAFVVVKLRPNVI